MPFCGAWQEIRAAPRRGATPSAPLSGCEDESLCPGACRAPRMQSRTHPRSRDHPRPDTQATSPSSPRTRPHEPESEPPRPTDQRPRTPPSSVAQTRPLPRQHLVDLNRLAAVVVVHDLDTHLIKHQLNAVACRQLGLYENSSSRSSLVKLLPISVSAERRLLKSSFFRS